MPDEPVPDGAEEPTPRLVRPYVARHHREPAEPSGSAEPSVSAESAVSAESSVEEDRVGRHGRHIDEASWAASPTAAIPVDHDQPEPPLRSGRAGLVMLAVGVVVLIVLGGVVALALTGRGPFAPTAARTSAPGIDQASAVAAPPSPTPTATPTPTPPAADRTGPLVSALPGSPCVDLRGNVKAVGTIVRTLTCDGTTAQEWTFGTDGTVRIDSTWCLASTGIVTTAGTLMTVAPCDTDPVQWRVLADTQIWNPTSGLCLTVAGETGAQLTIATCTGATGQEWTIP